MKRDNRLLPLALLCAALVGGAAVDRATPTARAQDAAAANEVDRLIADLGADDFKKRDEAQKKLEALGARALPALEKAEKESKDAEVRARAHEAIAAIRGGRAAPEGGKPKDREREGNPRTLTPVPVPDEQGQSEVDELMKLFGRENPMRDFNRIFERLQKQFEQFDLGENDTQQRGNVRIFQFGTRPRSPVEAKLGVTLNPPAPALRAQLELEGGLVVDELRANSPAWKAGLKPYDVIVSIDGKPVRTPADLAGLGSREATLEVVRKAKKERILVHAPEGPRTETKPEPKLEAPPKAEPKKEEPVRKF